MEISKDFSFRYIVDLIPLGYVNRPGKFNPNLFITVHDTGNTKAGAGALNHARYIKNIGKIGTLKSWHFTVDEKHVVQHLPVNETAFHAGDGAGDGNRKSIGIEICVNSDGNLVEAVNNAVYLTGWLCACCKIPLENIVQHHRWSGKNCPASLRAGRPYSWQVFLSQVNNFIENELIEKEKERRKDAWQRTLTASSGIAPKGIPRLSPAKE